MSRAEEETVSLAPAIPKKRARKGSQEVGNDGGLAVDARRVLGSVAGADGLDGRRLEEGTCQRELL